MLKLCWEAEENDSSAFCWVKIDASVLVLGILQALHRFYKQDFILQAAGEEGRGGSGGEPAWIQWS